LLALTTVNTITNQNMSLRGYFSDNNMYLYTISKQNIIVSLKTLLCFTVSGNTLSVKGVFEQA